MASLARRIAGMEVGHTPTATILAARAGGEAPDPTNTIAPYHTALNGVNQPMNITLAEAMWWMIGLAGAVVLLIRLGEIAWAQLRQISVMGTREAEKQVYWKYAQWSWMPSLRKNIIYAPLGHKRNCREIKLTNGIGLGALPTRLQGIILGVYLACNFAYMIILDFETENRYAFAAELRGRSGTLSCTNLIALVIFAGRNNPLISLLHISFDTYNLLHRWIGRTVVIETLIHTGAWAYVQVADGGWDSVWKKIGTHAFHGSGMVGTLAFTLIAILSLSPVRHAFYETFLNTHIILALIAFICTYIHCVAAEIPGGLPQLPWMIAIFCLWIADRVARLFRILYINWSKRGFSEATIEALPAECTRVTFHLPRYVNVKPGTHSYLRFWGISAWENHPFSAAWVDHVKDKNSLPISEKNGSPGRLEKEDTVTEVSYIIGAHSGFTRKLYNKALANGGPMRIKAAMEGPYAGHHSLDSYGHAVLFAGATGITHALSYLKHVIEGSNQGTIATRRVTLVWIMRDYEMLEVVRPWMNTLLAMPGRKDILRIQLFITRPKNPAQIVSPSSTVQIHPGRPNIRLILEREVAEQIGAMTVSICGPGALSDDVRAAVREMQGGVHAQAISFHSENFSW